MDPDVLLQELRDLVAFVEDPRSEVDFVTALDLVEKFSALDGWIGKGGFLPEAWRHK